MKLRKKIISTMMLLVLVVSQFSIFGDADTRKTLSIGERQVWYADSSLNGLETGYSKFQLGGRIAFCLDYRYSLPVSGSIPTYVRRLSPKATAVLKNGYPNVTPASLGCNTVDEAYLATQLAFWNVVGITGECDSYVPLKFSNLSAADGHGDDFYRALNAAKKLAANAFNSPYNPNPSMSISSNSADIKVANGQYVAGPYKVSVKDTTIGKYNVSLNAAPASAYVTNEAGEKTSQIGANKAFYIKWDASEKGQTIKYSASAVGQKSYVSMYRNGKNGIQSVAQEEFEDVNLSANEQLSFVQKNGAIELIKHDQNSERIQGVVFELKDASGNVIGENTSDKNGVVRFSDVKPGTYTLVEKSAPSGYIKGDKPISVTVKTGETFNVKCENTKVMGSLKIVKTDDAKNVLPGVTFEILNADRVIVDKITTDANGLATSKAIPMGKYTYREVAVPNGILIDSNEYPFEINTPNEVITKNIVNTRIKGSLKVIKVDDANKPLAGVTFEILNADRVIVDTIVTDAQGNATSKELVNGKYTYRETKVPAGIIIDSKEYPFETSGNVVVKTIINKRAKGNLKIVKTDDAKKVLPGVKFEILDQDKKVVDTITTNGRGEATSKYLPVGTYTYKEVEVPNGIILDNKEYTFKLEANKTIVKNIVNQRVKGSLKIVKVDEKNTPIAGVKFEILNKDNKVVETLTTNAKGEATSKSLVIGKYSYKEISAPAGYIVDTTVYPFEVTVNSTVITKKVVNRKAKGSIEIIKVDDSKNPLAGVKFEILDKNKNVVATLVTDENGKTNSAKLDYGTYFYKEVSAPSGIIIDTKEYEFKIETDGQVVIKNIVNEVVKGNLKIVKVDDADKALSGVTFEILNSDKKVVDTIVTNKDGIANSKVLAYGKYTYRETKVPNGIVLDSKEYPFEIKDNNKTIVKKIVNKRIKGNFEIIKTDDNKAPLSGVKFEILDSNKKVIKTVITDKNGKASVSGLTVGKYYYREVSAPEHIVLDTKVYPFEMTGKTVTVEIENKIIKGSLKIIKIDDVKKLPIAGVTFEILDSNKKLVDTIVTDKDGIATSKQLAYGKYTYKETKVPDGIVLDSAEFPFQVTENEKVIVKKIVNVKIKGNLGILKLDAETKEPIAGVKFEILDQNKNVIETIITDKDGKAVSSILYKGTYFYREVSAPDKYIVDNTVHKFNIESNGDLIEKTVYNKAKELPVTGGLGTNNLIFLLVSTLSVVGYVAFKKKEN